MDDFEGKFTKLSHYQHCIHCDEIHWRTLTSRNLMYWILPCSSFRSFSVITVEPVITHTSRWTAKSMGYWRLWDMGGRQKKASKNHKKNHKKSQKYFWARYLYIEVADGIFRPFEKSQLMWHFSSLGSHCSGAACWKIPTALPSCVQSGHSSHL